MRMILKLGALRKSGNKWNRFVPTSMPIHNMDIAVRNGSIARGTLPVSPRYCSSGRCIVHSGRSEWFHQREGLTARSPFYEKVAALTVMARARGVVKDD